MQTTTQDPTALADIGKEVGAAVRAWRLIPTAGRAVRWALQRAHYWTLYAPLRALYRRSYWHNARDCDICASLTGVRISCRYWDDTEDARAECADLISRNLDGWLAVAEVACYYSALLMILYFVLSWLRQTSTCSRRLRPNSGRRRRRRLRRRQQFFPDTPDDTSASSSSCSGDSLGDFNGQESR